MSAEISESSDQNQDSPKTGAYGRDKIILLMGLVTYGLGQSLLFTVFPPLARDIGLTELQFGLIFSISNFVLAAGAAVWGKLSDRWGRKPIILTGMFGYVIGTLLFALGLEAGLDGAMAPMTLFGILLFARCIYGAIASAIQPAATAYVADTTTEETRAKGMAIIGMSTGLGTIIGPIIGGALAFVSVVFPLYVAICLAIGGIILIFFQLPEPKRHKELEKSSLSPFDGRVLPYLIMWFVYFTAFTTLQLITAFYLEDKIGITDTQDIILAAMICFLCMAITTVIMQGAVVQMLNMSSKTMLRIACPIFTLGLLIMLMATSTWLIYFCYVLMGVAFSFATPGITGGASLSVSPNEQGAVGGYIGSASVLGMVVGPFLGPWLYGYSVSLPIIVGAAMLALLSLYAFTINVPEPVIKSE